MTFSLFPINGTKTSMPYHFLQNDIKKPEDKHTERERERERDYCQCYTNFGGITSYKITNKQ